MATQKERELMREIVDLACDVNMAGQLCAHVDINHSGVSVRISPILTGEELSWEWIYYPKVSAYFQGEVFELDHFEIPAKEFIAELKKHHPAYDSDGVKL